MSNTYPVSIQLAANEAGAILTWTDGPFFLASNDDQWLYVVKLNSRRVCVTRVLMNVY